MKAVKSFHNNELSRLKLSTLSRIVDAVTVPELEATENDVKRVFKGWGK